MQALPDGIPVTGSHPDESIMHVVEVDEDSLQKGGPPGMIAIRVKNRWASQAAPSAAQSSMAGCSCQASTKPYNQPGGVTTTALSCNRLSGHFVSPVTDALLDSQPDLTPKYFHFWQQVAFHTGMVSAAMEALTSLAWRQDLWMMIPQGLRCTGQTSLTGPCRPIRRTWR